MANMTTPGQAQTQHLGAALRQFLSTETATARITAALPKGMSPTRLVQQAMTLAWRNPGLLRCHQLTVLAGIIQAAELGLELSGPLGQAYLIPRKNKEKGIEEATFQIGWRGLLDLVFRSGKLASFPMRVVYKNDPFRIEYGSYQSLTHRPYMEGERGEAIGYYAIANMAPPQGGSDFEFMSHHEMVAFRRRFGGRSGPWETDFDAMATKTVGKRLLKRLPISVEVATAIIADEEGEVASPLDLAGSSVPVDDTAVFDQDPPFDPDPQEASS